MLSSIQYSNDMYILGKVWPFKIKSEIFAMDLYIDRVEYKYTCTQTP